MFINHWQQGRLSDFICAKWNSINCEYVVFVLIAVVAMMLYYGKAA